MNDENLDANLCKNCIYKFRRVFIPLKAEDYVDEDGDRCFVEDENIIIVNQCLVQDVDVSAEVTIQCSHYKNKDSCNFVINDEFYNLRKFQ